MKQPAGSLIFVAAGRAVLFFFAISLLLLLLYALGNFQEFLDSTQTFLLQLLTGASLLEVLVASYYLAFLGFWAVKYRRRYLIRIILTVLALVLWCAVFLGVKFLSAWLSWFPE